MTGRSGPALRSERICLWAGPLGVGLAGAGLLIAGLIPPPSPADGPEELALFWSETPDLRRAGLILVVTGTALFIPFAAAVAAALRRVEGPGSPMASVQGPAAAASAALGIAYAMLMLALTFDGPYDAGVVDFATAAAWIPFVGVWQTAAVQAAALGLGVLGDDRANPVLPRWMGWFSLWYVVTSLTGSLVGFFTEGPFAWNGFIALYVGAGAFFAWYVVVFAGLRRSLP